MRGGYTAGVLDAFIDNGIHFPCCVAVSAGACNALSYIARQRKRYYYANTRFLKDKKYMGLWSLLHTGHLFGNRFVFDDITFRLEPLDVEAFEREVQQDTLTVVTTDVQTGEACYDRMEKAREPITLVEASSSLPLISPMVEYNGRLRMDGGISDSIPVDRALAEGCDKLVVILTQDAAYRKKPNSLMPLLRLVYRKYPALLRALERRHIVYNAQLERVEQLEREGRAFVIRPGKPVEIGRMERDPEKITVLYEEGLREAEAVMDSLKAFLQDTAE